MTLIDKDLDEAMYQQLRSDPDFTSYLKNDQLNAYQEFVKLRSNYPTV